MNAGNEVVKSHSTFFLNVVLYMVHCDFKKVSQNQHFHIALLVEMGEEGTTQNSTQSTLLIMLTILDDPLGKMPHKWRLAARNG